MSDPLRARLPALVALWRESAEGEATSSEWNAAATSHQCADAIEALLREPPEAPRLDARAHLGDGESAAREARAAAPEPSR